MFSKIESTAHPPKSKPVLIWDGECGFCKYWITYLKQRTKDNIVFETYQEAASRFPDIPLKEFKKASRLIELDGHVYGGPDSLYRGLKHSDEKTFPWHRWYQEYFWFTRLNDWSYNYIAKNRPFMFKVTKALFGENPKRLKLYWIIYTSAIVTIIIFFSF
ncbi:MAG: DCC1-like thiol-disulfide oxidoreductase family protein [Pricia sp.]